jgi:hypothetical protein
MGHPFFILTSICPLHVIPLLFVRDSLAVGIAATLGAVLYDFRWAVDPTVSQHLERPSKTRSLMAYTGVLGFSDSFYHYQQPDLDLGLHPDFFP